MIVKQISHPFCKIASNDFSSNTSALRRRPVLVLCRCLPGAATRGSQQCHGNVVHIGLSRGELTARSCSEGFVVCSGSPGAQGALSLELDYFLSLLLLLLVFSGFSMFILHSLPSPRMDSPLPCTCSLMLCSFWQAVLTPYSHLARAPFLTLWRNGSSGFNPPKKNMRFS